MISGTLFYYPQQLMNSDGVGKKKKKCNAGKDLETILTNIRPGLLFKTSYKSHTKF